MTVEILRLNIILRNVSLISYGLSESEFRLLVFAN